MIKYSIIIPHRNIPDLLFRLLSTIPVREDLQVIVVDDCSDEKEWIKHLNKRFQHVVLILLDHNMGPGVARNIALKDCLGEKIIFADADDYFTPCLSEILDEYWYDQCDIVYFNSIAVDSNNYSPSSRATDRNIAFRKNRKPKDLRFQFTSPWGKMIKRELIEQHNVRFSDSMISEDVIFSTEVDLVASSYGCDERCIYCLTSRSNSLSNPIDGISRLEKVRIDWERLYILIKEGYLRKIPLSAIGEGLHYVSSSGDKDSFNKALSLCKKFGVNRIYATYAHLCQSIRYNTMRMLCDYLPEKFWIIAENILTMKRY